MRFNVKDSKQFSRLTGAVTRSRKRMESHREMRMKIIRQIVGKNYGECGSDLEMPINLMELAINIYMQHLCSANPMPSVSTKSMNLKPEALQIELDLTNLVKEIDLRVALRACVFEAMTGLGVMKVGVSFPADVRPERNRWSGQPFADAVLLDDLLIDMGATTPNNTLYVGDQYRMVVDDVRENESFDKEAREAVKGDDLNEARDGTPMARDITSGEAEERDDLYDRCTIRDLWIPSEKIVITYAVGGTKPLRVIDWKGPYCGPYHFLAFEEIPGNVMPLPPTYLWYDMNRIANNLYRKMDRQAERQKDLVAARGVAMEDAQRVQNSSDGEIFRTDDPGGVNEISFGGPSGKNMAFHVMNKDTFVYMAGNLDTIGGLSAQSPTLGQDRMLAAAASQRLAALQDRVVEFTKSVMESLAWYRWSDPFLDTTVIKQVGGMDIPSRLTSYDRKGRFMDYNFDIQPYSLRGQTPQEKLQTLTMTWDKFIAPYIPFLQASGGNIDFDALLRKVAQYTNNADLPEIYKSGAPQPEQETQQPPVSKPAFTERKTVRENRGTATRAGKDQNFVSTMMGADLQPAEKAMIF